ALYAAAGLTSKLHRAHSKFYATYVDRFACNWHRLSTTDPGRTKTLYAFQKFSASLYFTFMKKVIY
ncbi:MAG: hypothetical protein IKK97_05870, partial [Phascolarctobacterium sp.]|nr:hypothetical protein [Phascolarctobacterium sp.]